MEEEEDRILLSSLGVKSANPEDIERDVLEKVYIISFCLFTFFICYLHFSLSFTASISFEIDVQV